MMDTGASVKGDLSGHSKTINTVDWKTTRPFRLVTGSEDNKVGLFEGPPFQFMCTKTVSDIIACSRYYYCLSTEMTIVSVTKMIDISA